MLTEGLGLLATPINNLAEGFNNFISGIGDFFTNLIESLGDWFEDTILKMQELGENVGDWFEGVADSIAQFSDDVGDWFTNLAIDIYNWFVEIGEKIEDLAYSIGDWFEELGSNLSDFFDGLFQTLDRFTDYIDPLSDDFILKKAFIPSEEFIEMNNERMANYGREKFGFIDEFKGVVESLKDNINDHSNAPEFNMTLPSRWGGGTVSIINFEAYDSIRLLVKNIIRIFIWLFFIFKIYKRIPKIIY